LHFFHHLLLVFQSSLIISEVLRVEFGQLQEFPFEFLEISISVSTSLVLLAPLLEPADLLLSISHSSAQLLYDISQSTVIGKGGVFLLDRNANGFTIALEETSLKGVIIFAVA
jgi:hypothetical protein